VEIFKTQLFFEGYDEGHSYLVDTIFFENQWWLVATWLSSNTKSEKIPERLIRLSGLRYQEVDGKPYRFLLTNAIPKSVFDGREQEGYVIADYPVLESIQGSSTAH
jgi:hypothetical protein